MYKGYHDTLLLDQRKQSLNSCLQRYQDILFGFIKKSESTIVNRTDKFQVKQLEWFSNEINKGIFFKNKFSFFIIFFKYFAGCGVGFNPSGSLGIIISENNNIYTLNTSSIVQDALYSKGSTRHGWKIF